MGLTSSAILSYLLKWNEVCKRIGRADPENPEDPEDPENPEDPEDPEDPEVLEYPE